MAAPADHMTPVEVHSSHQVMPVHPEKVAEPIGEAVRATTG
ncbi:hypothetical protein [Kitasatospora sp. NBC_01266]|nr:hypothetical protein [Kitasatospora sp. NBC_01266]